jgi:hypothetical protein
LGIKREDCPAAFAGHTESLFFALLVLGYRSCLYRASILSHSRAPSTPPAGQTEKESEKAAQTKLDDFGGNERDGLHLIYPQVYRSGFPGARFLALEGEGIT